MAYRMCFICSDEIHGFFEIPNKKQSTAGTLCELLGLQLSDSTFTFGPKFQQAPYCPQCVKKMKEIRQMLNQLKELNKNIKEEKKLIENQLRKTCKKRQVLQKYNEDEDDEDSFHPFDRFREDVMKEIDGPDSDGSCGFGSARAPQQKQKKSTEVSTFKKCVTEPMKRLKIEIPRCNSGGKRRTVQQSSEYVESIPTDCASQNQPQLTRKTRSRAGPKSRVQNERDNADVDSEGNVLDNSTTAPTILETDHGEVVLANADGIDPLSVGFYSIVYGEDGSDNSENDVGGLQQVDSDLEDSLGQEIFVEATPDGKFRCPYAPACETSFDTNDKADFISHVQDIHQGVFPKLARTDETLTEEVKVEKSQKARYKCKFCNTPHKSIALLNSHYGREHFDKEWRSVSSKRKSGTTDTNPSQPRKKLKTQGEGLHKCGVCGKGYSVKTSLDRHERKHTGVKPYACDACEERFFESRDLRVHRFNVHNLGKQFSCPKCDVKMVYKHQMKRHKCKH